MNTANPGCGWLDATGHACGVEVSDTIVLRDRLIAAEVLVCRSHKAEYNRMAASSRLARQAR